VKAIIAGVYFLFDGKDIVYVGQSADIFRRIYEHSSGRAKGEKKKFDTWESIEISDEAERFRAEHLLILALRPKYNIDYKGWSVEGDFAEWDYNIYDMSGNAIAFVTKELFNWTDTYLIDVDDPNDALTALMLVIAIDAEKCSRRD
jgi:hypothetical protein